MCAVHVGRQREGNFSRGACWFVADGGLDEKKVGALVSKVISGADFAAQHATSPHHASHPMRVILDLDEKSGVLGADYFFAATLCLVSFDTRSARRRDSL